ncbi:putative bifunctional diguanylate cyclase/phosphodiesterase [Sphingomonas desiccabilis]|uniref:EAL domain-containing protein n=1 Tax=Sphingomonas desiccabilis TaxID=429134 RepID=A0A4Q2J0D3_9SPHN|nr:EAL domain-containing protein [Sphingomonas desiccabilis]MBB3910034.1 diguanylate cyclase (GGDEF)-like protein [Sphingomonas desiccabilis]RXZ34732.1 EAL domain-containing protein [Sphingomonas desiccabilis]
MPHAKSLKRRAIVFAACAGAVSFFLALLATTHGRLDALTASSALIPAVVCATMCWASAERHVSTTAGAVDEAILRLSKATRGDLQSPIPRPVWNFVPSLARAMQALFDQLRTTLEAVERAAQIDTVTELPNRSHFQRLVEARLERLGRMQPSPPAALLFLDLDRFKAVNDTYGHATGDLLLAQVGERLRQAADHLSGELPEDQPIVGRLGGDEFNILLCGQAARDPKRVALGILNVLDAPHRLLDCEIQAGASIGIAQWPAHGCDFVDLTRAADTAMYAAKAGGRGRVHAFDAQLAAALAARKTLEQELRRGIDRGEFGLVFQPQVLAVTGSACGAEALVRWHHPDGMRLPASFLPCAEETGLIIELGDQIIQEVAATIGRWHAKGIRHRLSVNISASELDHASFVRKLRNAVASAGAPASMLELELKESLLMRCSEDALDAVTVLRGDGASVALDDFGTGFSSIARLRELPIDRVKLDRALTIHVAESDEARAIAQALVGLVHGLGCTAVAEGIESAEQAKMLRMIGCDVLQGYAIAAPMEEEAFLDWLDSPAAGRRLAG